MEEASSHQLLSLVRWRCFSPLGEPDLLLLGQIYRFPEFRH